MKKEAMIFLEHILDSIDKIDEFTEDISEEDFLSKKEKGFSKQSFEKFPTFYQRQKEAPSEGRLFEPKVQKGVSPVIATILMVMIAVGLVAFSYTFMRETGEGSKEQSDIIMEGISQQLSSCLKVESSKGNKMWIRNCGEGYITNESLSVYVDEVPAKFSLRDLDNLSNPYPYIGRYGRGEISILGPFFGRKKVKLNFRGFLQESRTLDFGSSEALNNIPKIISIGLSDGIYNWWITCNADSVTNSSEIRIFNLNV